MKTFQLFVAEHTRNILAHLHNPALARDEHRDAFVEVSTTDTLISPTHELEVSAAEVVADHNYVFPSPQGAAKVSWCVMVGSQLNVATDGVVFELMGRMRAELTTQAYLAACYQAFFGRDVDLFGLANYTQLLESGQITRRDFLCILLRSGEALARAHRFLLIPEPSSWLATFKGTQDASTPFPRFIVKRQG